MEDKIKEFAIYNEESNKEKDWTRWLIELHTHLILNGYRKHSGKYKTEDFTYWKNFDEKYQIGILVYDFRKYANNDMSSDANKVSITYECMILEDSDRIDLTVSKRIELGEFERLSKSFYKSMKPYFN